MIWVACSSTFIAVNALETSSATRIDMWRMRLDTVDRESLSAATEARCDLFLERIDS